MLAQSDILFFLKENKDYFHNHFNIIKIGIFGSFARNQQTEKSDIDLLVVFDENTSKLFEKRMELKEYVHSAFKREVDVCHEKAIKPVFKDLILSEAIYA